MTTTLATQYHFTGTYELKVDPSGRIRLSREVLRGLEEKVIATVLGDPELEMNEFGVRYQNHWVYGVTQPNIRSQIREVMASVNQEEREAPDIFYKQALLNAKILIHPAEEARKVLLRQWKYEEEGKEREYMTMELNLDVLLAHIRNREDQDKKYVPERVMEEIYMSTQAETIDAQGRIYFGRDHEIMKKVLGTTERKIILLGMDDMFVFITPEQREAMQRRELQIKRKLIHMVRT